MIFDVKSIFDAWYAGDTKFGSLSTLRVPFSLTGKISGTVTVTIRNSLGVSNAGSFSFSQ